MLNPKITAIVSLASFMLAGCVSQKEYDKLQEEKDELQEEKDELQANYDDLSEDYELLKSDMESIKKDLELVRSQIQPDEKKQSADVTDDKPEGGETTPGASNPYEDEMRYAEESYDYMTEALDKLKNTILDDLKKL